MGRLDVRTILFAAVLTDVICTLVMGVLWRQNRRRFRGLEFWVTDFAFQAVGVLLIFLRGAIPDWISIILANGLIISGAILGLVGLERFLAMKGPRVQNLALLFLFLLIHTILTVGHPRQGLRNLNLSLALFLICFQCLWLLLHRAGPALRPLTRWVGLVFGGYCLICLYRMVQFVVSPRAEGDFFRSGLAEDFVQVAFQMLFILLTFTLALMVNKRLLLEIRLQEEKFSKAFHFAPYAVFLTRLSDGRIFEVNEGFARTTGYSVPEVLGKTTVELGLWARAGDRAVMVDDLRERGKLEGRESRFRKKDGELMTGVYSAEIITVGGEPCILSVIDDVSERRRAELERERLVGEREKALSEVKVLSGMLPICAHCKKVRDDRGYWNQIESYIESHTEAEFSHGICPECMRELYPAFARKVKPD